MRRQIHPCHTVTTRDRAAVTHLHGTGHCLTAARDPCSSPMAAQAVSIVQKPEMQSPSTNSYHPSPAPWKGACATAAALKGEHLPTAAAPPPFVELLKTSRIFSDLLIQHRELKLPPGAGERDWYPFELIIRSNSYSLQTVL